MKNLNVVLGVLLVAMVGFSSCSKSDDDKKKGPALPAPGGSPLLPMMGILVWVMFIPL